ncbi:MULTISPECIES: NAD(P)/FAD-dependent oxidoreductase [Vagococcus]|uniref:Ferredoxin--NADP reductase n=1 Tax=Vagococcus fluvialis bH819 TaxID=1255619 RepID=A0A1X6WSI7_9ENTE|nr:MULTISPECIES: NAD(P)/FAD-dependent oxidoreductase [Vagococcus]SLM87192.1 Thioredoxin reductase [Vagococcus fluvialis bH819]HCM90074.1 NAD(P)/FAD-dependent oxidoreductase [Vagococcus sp.]
MNENIYDITIIGGGPTGLFAGFYAGMRQAKTKIIEVLPGLGGQLSLLYPEKLIYDVAGFPNVKAQDLINSLIKQIEPFNHTICLEEEVLSFSKENNLFEIKTNKETHYSKTIIIAAGNGSFQPRRLNLEGNDTFENKQLHYHIKDMSAFSDKNVTICGGGDSAVDWALMLEDIATSVTLIHRRPTFRAHEHSVNKLFNSTINIKTPYVITSLNESNDKLSSVTINNPKEDINEEIPLDDLIVNYGFSSSLGPIKKWPLDFKGTSILTKSNTETSIPGIFAIGDITTYEGKVKLIATGFGEAPTAINNAIHYINPKERLQPMHSTSLYE